MSAPGMQPERSLFIDFARGFSILTIVVYHYLLALNLHGPVAQAVRVGGAGVHLFMFASGFGLALGKQQGYVAFMSRRFRKVLIPYYVVVTLIFGLNLFLGLYPAGFDAYLSHILLYKMFVNTYDSSFGYHFWFISTIIQFYLVFPLIDRMVRQLSPRRAVLTGLLVSLSYTSFVYLIDRGDQRVWNSFFLQFFWEFVLGMVVARTRLLPTLLATGWPVVLATCLGGFAGMWLLSFMGGSVGRAFNDYFSFVGYTSACILVYKAGTSGIRVLAQVFIGIGAFSYSLYLIHYLVLHLYLRLLAVAQPRLIDGIVALGIALLTAPYVEKGMQQLLNQLGKKPARPALTLTEP
jgi:peptidoglycan/LPS O-acetylase OafA/YrhL